MPTKIIYQYLICIQGGKDRGRAKGLAIPLSRVPKLSSELERCLLFLSSREPKFQA
jgi:hypothetical protein